MNIKYFIPDDVRYIMQKINEAGFEAYAVGGCVRDTILNSLGMEKEIHDWDIASSAEPEDIMRIFPKVIPTGIRFGTVTVMINSISYEVTMFRADGKYSDGRRPDEVTKAKGIVEDLQRRDLTINAISMDCKGQLIYEFWSDGIKINGIEDLKNKMIKCVGNPDKRFNEDALRMMRAVRFAAQLGFQIEENTFEAIKRNCEKIRGISTERIREEFEKIIMSDNPEKARLLCDAGIMDIIMPEFSPCVGEIQNNPHHCFTVDEHIYKVVKECSKDLNVRLAAFFHDIAKPETKSFDEVEGMDHFIGHAERSAMTARKVMIRLRYSNKNIQNVCEIISCHETIQDANEKTMRRMVRKFSGDSKDEAKITNAKEIIEALFDLRKADIMAQSQFEREEKLSKLVEAKESFNKIWTIKEVLIPCINGYDIKAMGYEGKEIGKVINHLRAVIEENPAINNREDLLKIATDYKNNEAS